MAGDVLHFHGLGSRAFAVDNPRIGPHQRGDAASDEGIVIGGLDAETLEQPIAEMARRLIDRVHHQEVVAGLEEGQQRRRDG